MTPPDVAGTAADGQMLSSDPGVWDGTTPMVNAYQWRRCDPGETTCNDINGATDATYAIDAEDVGSKLKVEVTATNVAGSGLAGSTATSVVVANPPVNTVPPAISGLAQEGATLTSDTGTWTGTPPVTFAYQWRRCDASGLSCLDIIGALFSTYSPTVLDLGSRLRVAVTATNLAGSSTAVSAATAPVSGPADIQPSFPIRAAFYYPWYPQTWTVNGSYPHYTPSLGYYDSSSTAVIQQHVHALEYGNVEAGIASWWGRGRPPPHY